MKRPLVIALFTLLALSAMSQDMVLVGPRVRITLDTLFLPITTDVDLLDLRGPVESVAIRTTYYVDNTTDVDSTFFRFDPQGYYASRTLHAGTPKEFTVSYTNTYRRGRLQQVQIVAGQGDCSLLTYRYDLSGNVIGNVVSCSDHKHIISTTIYDRFRNPISKVAGTQADSYSYRYNPTHPGQAITSTCASALPTGDTLYFDTRYIYTTEGYIARTITAGPTERQIKTVDYIYDDHDRLIMRETFEGNERTVDTYTRDARGSLLTHTQRINGELILRKEFNVTYK